MNALQTAKDTAEMHAANQLGTLANAIAAGYVFQSYQQGKAANTKRRQENDLDLFGRYLVAMKKWPPVGDLATNPAAWTGVTWGIVEGFQNWLLLAGYAVSTVNYAVTTVRVYCRLASKAGIIPADELKLIQEVKSKSRKQAAHIDAERTTTRQSTKKAEAVALATDQAARLKVQPDTPQGRRDTLLMCLLLDHGLRVGEVESLTVDCFTFEVKRGKEAGYMTFYREKVAKVQRHRLTPDTLAALRDYLAADAPAMGSLWRTSRKGKAGLQAAGWTDRAITKRVRTLGETIGIHGLSAHDCRHYWATQAARSGTPMDALQQAGGWSSLAMPSRYIQDAEIANERVVLAE